MNAFTPSVSTVTQQAAPAGPMNGIPMSPLHKQVFEKVKKAEIDEVVRLVRENNLDVNSI